VADNRTDRDRGRIRSTGWDTDVHPLARVGNAVGGLSADVSGGALMLQLTPQSRIFLAVEPVDFRAGIDRLAAFCRERLAQNPLEGAVYVFRNRRRTALKLLLYDGQGYWLCTKRLSQGQFHWWPHAETTAWRLSARELHILLWNGHPEAAHMAEDWRRVA
jgi:transposase